MLEIVASNRFNKDLRLAQKRGYNMAHLQTVVDLIANGEKLPEKYRDHELTGQYKNFRECHIEPDWLLIYRTNQTELMLFLFRTGTHSDLF